MHAFWAPTVVMLLTIIVLAGCASQVRWWRAGDCVVIYDTRKDSQQIIAAGQQCEVKRAEIPVAHGAWR